MVLRRRRCGARAGRCAAVASLACFLLPFTLLLMVADHQYHLTYNSKRAFYQEYVWSNTTLEDGFLTRERWNVVSTRMVTRREHLERECSKLGLDSDGHKANAWEFIINRQYHLIWCNIFKAASTSWMYNFNLMANYSAAYLNKTKEVPLNLARKKYARPSAEMVRKASQDSISFLIVRHPLERLASAYNDKIVHAWPKTFHEKMGHRIVMKYRKKIKTADVPKERYPVFEEFVQYVLDEARAKRMLDMHWTPYSDFCTPCRLHFDIIMKFETLDEDQRYLIQLARLQNVIRPQWRNSGARSDNYTVSKLYSRLTRHQLDALYKLYRNDFALFNYTIDSYYPLVKDELG